MLDGAQIGDWALEWLDISILAQCMDGSNCYIVGASFLVAIACLVGQGMIDGHGHMS